MCVCVCVCITICICICKYTYIYIDITQEQCRVYAQNLSLRDEIEKDTKRTWPDLHFFREEDDFEGAEDEHYDGGTGLPGN